MKTIVGLTAALLAGASWAAESIVIVPAHPDDLIASIGLCLKAKDKFDVHVIDFTRGERGLGRAGLIDGSTLVIRKAEEEAVCKAVGAKLHWLDEVDGEAYASRESCHKLANLLKEIKPRAVFAHFPLDVNGDHTMAGAAAIKATFLSGFTPEIYFFQEEYQTKAFEPDCLLDITDVKERKYEIVRLYACQYRDGGIERRLRCTDQYQGMHSQMLAAGYAESFRSFYPRLQGEKRIFDEFAPTPPPRGARRFQGAREELPRAARAEEFFWADRLAQKRREIAQSGGTFDLVFVGDSITHAWENEKTGLPVAKAGLKKFKVLNLGYSGNRTEQMIWRLRNGELDGYKAKLFMVMAGTNNANKDAPADVALGIETIVRTIRTTHPEAKVLLLPIFPRGTDPSDRARQANEKVNAIIKGLADGKDILWLDFNSAFTDEKGGISTDVMYDRLHLTTKGFGIWLEKVLPAFESACAK